MLVVWRRREPDIAEVDAVYSFIVLCPPDRALSHLGAKWWRPACGGGPAP